MNHGECHTGNAKKAFIPLIWRIRLMAFSGTEDATHIRKILKLTRKDRAQRNPTDELRFY
ncbi:MAG: hypothetical protein OXI67_20080 [Candidatus Poribacteria bacterium]|nr:hypothetical protein [Candidatus Poribacteria bacterium]